VKLTIEKSVCIITPTIGESELLDVIESVEKQTYRNIKHLIVCDGPDYFQKALNNITIGDQSRIQITTSPENTGGSGFYGHRIYAAYPHLLNEDYIAFLDADNWIEPNHIQTLVDTLESRNDLSFSYSFRKIFDKEKNFITDDDCESLGKWPVWPVLDRPDDPVNYLIDTSSFLFKKDFIQQTCHLWHSGWGGDRKFLHEVITNRNVQYEASKQHTLCYRLGGNQGSVGKNFFIKGNEATLQYYKGNLPWK